MPVEHVDDIKKSIETIEGTWETPETYIMTTPAGYLILHHYANDVVNMKFIYNNIRYTRRYIGVKTQRHAVTLAKQFYRDLWEGTYDKKRN